MLPIAVARASSGDFVFRMTSRFHDDRGHVAARRYRSSLAALSCTTTAPRLEETLVRGEPGAEFALRHFPGVATVHMAVIEPMAHFIFG